MFGDFVERAKEKAAKDEKQRKRVKADFFELLEDSKFIKYDTTWEDARPDLEREPEFKAVSLHTIQYLHRKTGWLLKSLQKSWQERLGF